MYKQVTIIRYTLPLDLSLDYATIDSIDDHNGSEAVTMSTNLAYEDIPPPV